MVNFRTLLSSMSEEDRKYWLKHLPEQCANPKQINRLFGLLTNFDFLAIKIKEIGVQEVIRDFNLLSRQDVITYPSYNLEVADTLRLVQKSLQQSANILEDDKNQLPGQLLARLFSLQNPALLKLLEGEKNKSISEKNQGAKECDLYPWLQPLTVGIGSIDQPFEKNIPTRHDGEVDKVAISGNGNLMLSAKKNQVKLWDVATGENKFIFEISAVFERKEEAEIDEVRQISPTIDSIALSFDGHWAAIGFDVCSKNIISFVEVWNLLAEKRLIRIRVAKDGFISSLAISESGQQIVIGFSGELCTVWSLNKECTKVTGTASLRDRLFSNESQYSAVALSPNGQWVATASDKFLLLWDLVKGRLVHSASISSKAVITALTLDRHGIIKAIFADGTLNIWNFKISENLDSVSVERGLIKLERRFQLQLITSGYSRDAFIALIMMLRQSPKILGMLSKLSRRYWAKKRISWLILQIQKPILRLHRCVAHERDNPDFFARRCVRSSDLKILWRLIQLFSPAKPKTIRLTLKGLDSPETISANGEIGLSKTKTDEIQLINLETASSNKTNKKDISTYKTNKQLLKIYEPWKKAIAISLDGKWLFSLGKNNTLQMWDVATRQPYIRLKLFKISSFLQRLKYKKNYPVFKTYFKFNNVSTKFLILFDIDHLASIIFLYQSRIFRKIYNFYTFLSHIIHQDLLIKNVDLVAKSLNGRWLFLISKNSFDVRDLAREISEGSDSRWYLRNVSSNGKWGLWQSSTRTLRVTNLKTGELVGTCHDYYGDLADTERWRLGREKNKNPWQQNNWKYEYKFNNAVSIGSNGNAVILYDSGDFDTWIWELFQYLVRWNVREEDTYKILSNFQTPKFRLTFDKESSQEKWVLSITALNLFSDSKRAIFALETGEIKLCNMHQVIHTFAGHKMSVTEMSFSEDEQWAVSCSLDRAIKVWHLPSLKQVASFTTDSALYTCKITQIEEQLFVIAGDAVKRTHVLQLHLPENSEFSPEEPKIQESVPECKNFKVPPKGLSLEDLFAGKSVSEDAFIPDSVWQDTIGLPLPLYRLKTLPEELHSELDIDYSKLAALLKTGLWLEAENETKRIFLKALGKESNQEYFNSEELRNFSSLDLLTMDRLWLKYSEGRYGFSLQMRIWEKFHHNYSNFLRIIGRDDIGLPCELIERRRGYFPYMSFLHDSKLTRKFYTRLAECSGYPHIADPLSREEIDKIPLEVALSSTPNYQVGISEYILPQNSSDTTKRGQNNITSDSIQLKGFPGDAVYIKLQVVGSGILQIRLNFKNHLFWEKELVFVEKKEYKPQLLHIPLPTFSWDKDLLGSLKFLSSANEKIAFPLIPLRISCNSDLEIRKQFLKIKDLCEQGDSSLYRLLELQQKTLGKDNLNILLTLDKLIQKCEKLNRYSEAELFKNQKKEIYQENHKHILETGDEKSKVVLFLSSSEMRSSSIFE